MLAEGLPVLLVAAVAVIAIVLSYRKGSGQ